MDEPTAIPLPETDGDKRKFFHEHLRIVEPHVAKQDSNIWLVFGLFMTSNAGLLNVLFRKEGLVSSWPAFVVALVGIVISHCSYRMIERIMGHLTRAEDIRLELERLLSIPANISISLLRDKAAHHSLPGRRVRDLMTQLPDWARVLWTVAAMFFLILAVTKLTESHERKPIDSVGTYTVFSMSNYVVRIDTRTGQIVKKNISEISDAQKGTE